MPPAPHVRLPLFALLAANVISQVGNFLTALAIPWFVLTTTGSAGQAGIAAATGALPVIFAGIFGGAVVDRLGYRLASIVADLASGVTVALIPLLDRTVGLAFWQLLALVFLGALLDTPGNSARQSLFPELIALAGMRPERANATYAIARRIAGLVGPPLAGLLIATLGASDVLWLDAATFAVSALVVAVAIPRRLRERGARSTPDVRRYLREIGAGFTFLRRDALLAATIVVFALGSLLAEPLYAVILPVYAREVFGSATGLGIAFSALAAGSLAGNGLYLLVGSRLSRRAIYIGGFAIRALAFCALVTLPSLGGFVLMLLLAATCFEPINPLAMTIMQERVPEGMRGRVFGVSEALGAGTLPLGILVYGLLLDTYSLVATMVFFAATNLALPLIMLVLPALRDMDSASKPAARSV